jgi:uncharacterized protein YbjQ (UPF0145 family)
MTDPISIPPAAGARIADTAGGGADKAFTSTLSVDEFVVLQQAGFEPLGVAVGTSIYHVGIQVGRWNQNQELTVLTQAMYEARTAAISRMTQEAQALNADGVTGVNLELRMYAWGQEVLEFSATGTAVRYSAQPNSLRAPSGSPFTSDLTAREFYLLHQAGFVPVSMVLGTCVYHIAHQSILKSLGQVGRNQEMDLFTQGIYEARELALGRMQAETDACQARGVVGVDLQISNHIWGEHATEFFAIGTAIRPHGQATSMTAPALVFDV